MRAVIRDVTHFLPEKKLTNHDLESMVDTNDEWITSRTGIKQRRILEKSKGTSYMAVRAAEKMLKRQSISADEIDLIILATVTPDMPVPSAVSFVQQALKAYNCWGFDLNGGCTGFLYALSTASQFIENGRHKKVLVIGADKMSSIVDYNDRNTCVIFGDGAGAVLLEPPDENGDEAGIYDFDLYLDGSGAKYLNVAAGGSLHPATHETVDKNLHYVYQDGKTVFKHAVKGMSEISVKLIERNNLTVRDIAYLIPHQANARIIDAVSRKIGLKKTQIIENIESYGNTTAATIPIALSEACQKNLFKSGDWLLLSAFGAGFTWGSMLIKWGK